MAGGMQMDQQNKKAVSAEQAELLRQPRLAALSKQVDRGLVVEVARAVLADLRARIAAEMVSGALPDFAGLAADPSSLEEQISAMIERILAHSLQPVINATGVILHTNLGRAPLTEAAVSEFRRTATQYSNLEYDLEAGARGKRDVHTGELLTRLT